MSTESEHIVAATDVDRETGTPVSAVGMIVRNKETFFLPAEELKGYESTGPGSGERLLALMEQQAQHRMRMEEKTLDRYFIDRSKHFITGFVALLIFAGLAVFFAVLGLEWAAVTAVGCPALYGLSNLVAPKKEQRNVR
jgi:uncharacterized membrane protein